MFGAGEEPAAELFAVERGGSAVERGVGLAVWGKEEIGFVAREQEVIEGREFPGFCAASLHVLLVEIYQGGWRGPGDLAAGGGGKLL